MDLKNKSKYREGLPAIPQRLLHLPVERGYPVPWFVDLVDGHYDFRVMDSRKIPIAIKENLCWICGEKLGSFLAFTIGPMCSITRTISEPPSHRECAEFSIKACPFLTQQQYKRNETNLPEGCQDPAGVAIKRQPGAVCLWITKSFRAYKEGHGILFKIGEPEQIFWFREERAATRDEVWHSIETGLPILREAAKVDGGIAVQQLEDQIKRAHKYLPAESPKKNLFGSAAKR